MTGRSKYAVHFYREDGFIVRGTLDPVAALGLAIDEEEFEFRYGSIPEGAMREPSVQDWMPSEDAVGALAELCHDLIRDARPGLYRFRPASRHADGKWWIDRAEQRGRGVFEGVEFLD